MTADKGKIRVQCGTMMVQQGLLLPEHMDMVTAKYSEGWQSVTDSDGCSVDRKLRQLGWECFFIAGELRAISFGFSQARVLKAAVRRLLATVRSLNLNCVEFTEVRRRSFIGIPYVTVAGHARHIQQGHHLEAFNGKEARKS